MAKPFANVETIVPLPAGTAKPGPAMSTPIYFSLDPDEFEEEIFRSLSEKRQTKIGGSPEWMKLVAIKKLKGMSNSEKIGATALPTDLMTESRRSFRWSRETSRALIACATSLALRETCRRAPLILSSKSSSPPGSPQCSGSALTCSGAVPPSTPSPLLVMRQSAKGSRPVDALRNVETGGKVRVIPASLIKRSSSSAVSTNVEFTQ